MALQGVAYWIGHRRCHYRGYHLSEGALVAEVCNLIHANLPSKMVLECEVQYSTLVGRHQTPTDLLTERARADLVVKKAHGPGGKLIPRFVIEVKRAAAPSAEINKDLARLANLRTTNPRVRAFLFLISEARLPPSGFVDEDGNAVRGKRRIGDSSIFFQVRHAWKAAPVLTMPERAQYACLVEVDPRPPRVRLRHPAEGISRSCSHKRGRKVGKV
jgi:hypothetical protein